MAFSRFCSYWPRQVARPNGHQSKFTKRLDDAPERGYAPGSNPGPPRASSLGREAIVEVKALDDDKADRRENGVGVHRGQFIVRPNVGRYFRRFTRSVAV